MQKKSLKSLDIDYLKEKAKQNRKTPKNKLQNTIIRARKILKILERDEYKCVMCSNNKELTIDHINGRKFAKHDNAVKYRLSECQTLCIKCHTKKNKIKLIK